MGYIGKNLKLLTKFFVGFLCFALVGCGSNGDNGDKFVVNVAGYSLIYNGNVELGKVALKTDDLDEIVDLYQEIGDDVGYRDSLLIAEKYDQGLGINTFAQSNLDILKEKGLTIADLKKTQIKLERESEIINAVLVEYKVTGGLIEKLPLLYVSQLFIPDDHNVILISFITEDSSSHSSAVKMFKNIN